MENSNSFTTGILGKTGLKVGRLGVSGGYGAPAKAFEMAYERGCNYFYHGSIWCMTASRTASHRRGWRHSYIRQGSMRIIIKNWVLQIKD